MPIKFPILLALLMSSGLCLAADAPLPEDTTDYVALVDYCADHNPTCGASAESNAGKEWQALLDAGERAYPALADELVKTGDAEVVSVISQIFTQSSGDKTLPLQAMRTCVELNARETPALALPVIRAWVTLGGAAEMECLWQFRDHPDKDFSRQVDTAINAISLRVYGPPPQVPRPPAVDDRSLGDKAVLWAWMAMAVLVTVRIGLVVYQRMRRRS
ncbi:MAG: hypothetical protein EOP88_11210 [Verrucomicrobiaceae bacterium]|nr:MAG: hypothetical protein EOP88_11210 [Verrucomicrobiaceae bacterium]